MIEEQDNGCRCGQRPARGLEDEYNAATIVKADFIEFALRPDTGKFNLIVGNPPFIKRVAYGKAFGDRVRELAAGDRLSIVRIKECVGGICCSVCTLDRSWRDSSISLAL